MYTGHSASAEKSCRKTFHVGNMGLSSLSALKTAGQLKNERGMTDFTRGAASKDTGEGRSCTTSKEPQTATEKCQSWKYSITRF